MEKVRNIIYKTMLSFLFILVLLVTYDSIFNIYKSPVKMSPFVLIIGTTVCVTMFITLKQYIKKVPEKWANTAAIILCIAFFALLAAFGLHITSIPTYDLSDIIREAGLMVKNGGKFVTESYFSVYSNQVPLAVFVYYIYKLGTFINIVNLKSFAIITNAACIAITAFFTFLSVKKTHNYVWGLLTLLFFIVNPIFYAYSSYFYSDTLSMPFVAIAFYMLIKSNSEKLKYREIFMLCVAGWAMAIAFKIRVVSGILIVAFMIWRLLTGVKKKDVILLSLAFVIGIFLCNILETQSKPIINRNLQYPPTHWLVLGTNEKTDGRWNLQDFMLTSHNTTYEDKLNNNINTVTDRINKLGLWGTLSFIRTKLSVNWSNGCYDYIPKLINAENITPLYEYIAGNRKVFFVYYCQICKIVILGITLLVVMKALLKKDSLHNEHSMVLIALLGAFLFYMIWEVLTRYSLTFLPWMFLLYPTGIKLVERAINETKLNQGDNNRILNKNRIEKIVVWGVLLSSLFLLVLNYKTYVVEKREFWDKRVMQYSSKQGNLIPVISDNKIEQTFVTSKKFNAISIKFIKHAVKKETNYLFTLKNSAGDTLVTKQFTSNKVIDNKLKTFFFDDIKPQGREEYIIELCSTDATDEDSIGIATFYQENYDAYPQGIIRINGEPRNADMTFQVQNVVERAYVSKRIYILLSIVIITIEIFAFYPLYKNKFFINIY